MRSSQENIALLLVFAHPDDEFAVFPWIRRAVDAGVPVHAVWLTDGGWGGQSIPRREAESRQILRSLGVDEKNMHFLGARMGIPDGKLHLSLEKAEEVLLQLISSIGDVEVMAPAWEGGHQDHDAAHLVVVGAMGALGTEAWEYSLYNSHGLSNPFFTVLSLPPRVSDVQSLEISLPQRFACIFRCLQFRSQWKSFLGLLPVYAWRLLSDKSAFKRRRIHGLLTMQRPHQGELLYERRTGLSWDEFASITDGFRQKIIRRCNPMDRSDASVG